ncbi:MAG: hypothetical protein R3C09_03805 [Pirellulaceae bacterium]
MQSGKPKILAELRPSAEDIRAASLASDQHELSTDDSTTMTTNAVQPADEKKAATGPLAIDFSLTPVADDDAAPSENRPQNSEGSADILDLNTFLSRLDGFVEQLRKADLPATAFMIEALGLGQFDTVQAGVCWSKTIEVVLENLRGIDVTCLYRPYTLCVFLPGSSCDAGLIRAGKTKLAVLEASALWNTSVCFEKLAVSVATIGAAEDNAGFLNRLELALEDAVDSSHQEIVVHDGNTCHFQQT